MLQLKPGHDPEELRAVMQALGDIAIRLPGCGNFVFGPNRDFEAKSPDHPFGFTLDFNSEADLTRYANDNMHRRLGARLVDLCVNGTEGIMVFDLEMSDPGNR